MMKKIESITEKGTGLEEEEIHLSHLKKLLAKKDTKEEDLLWIQLLSQVEDEEGKESLNYFYRKIAEIRVAAGGQNEKQLLSEAEELIRLAYSNKAYQLEIYTEMLWRLAILAYEHKRKSEFVTLC